MLTKNQQKLICQLHQKKYRILHQLFIAEGKKTVFELLDANLQIEYFITTDKNLINHQNTQLITDDVMKKISCLDTPSSVLAVFKIPEHKTLPQTNKILVLDQLKDPGNLGTIIRLCDWFGIEQLVCSHDTVEAFNPKVVMASMGSIGRVKIFYTDLQKFLSQTTLPIYGAFLEGEQIYKCKLPNDAVLVMGSESHGIGIEVEKLIHHRLTIPQFSIHQKTESLNVGTATAVLLSEWLRP